MSAKRVRARSHSLAKSLFCFLATTSLVASQTGCTRPTSAKAPAAAREPKQASPANVKIQVVEPVEVTDRIKVTAQTVADSRVTYSAEIPGRLDHLPIKLGQRIRQGQVLARIDYTSLKAQADEAEASLLMARKTVERLTALRKSDLVPQDKLDQASTNAVAAEARSRIARANVAKGVIRARRAGVVTRKMAEAGEFVTPGKPLLTVVNHATVVVSGRLAESQVVKVRRGTPVKVRIANLNRTLTGKVHVVVPVADPGSKTFEVRVRLRNPDLSIKVGVSALLEIAASATTRVVLAPQDVVLEDGDGRRSVFVEDGGIARQRRVSLGSTHGDKVTLVRGVRQGDRLVVVGHRDLFDGQRIEVVPESDPESPPKATP